LGIDAAWTLTQPSGLALVGRDATGWRLIAAAASYRHFFALKDGGLALRERPIGSPPDALSRLESATQLNGRAVDLVAIDMPLAHSPIRERRHSDNEVSRAYGKRKCGTHSPSTMRPGEMSDKLNEGFTRAGYPLQTRAIAPPGLIEVYPHTALVELAGAPERLRYKASKVRAYWPALSAHERRECLYDQWRTIVDLLEREIRGVRAALPELPLDASAVEVKAYEDALDAVVCAWVGICALEGRATPLGDEDSAIWIPLRTATVRAT
jgi:predicted RNase H-like nuclease